MSLPSPTSRGLSMLATAFADRPFAGTLIGMAGVPLDDVAGGAAGGADAVHEPAGGFESLEGRQMMSVSVDAGGWTVIAPAADSRVVYVSSAGGSDVNNGLSASAPVKTLAKATTLIRNNSADQLLLKRGDVWHESFGNWIKSGRSEQEPVVIGAYGAGDRPLLMTGTSTAITIGSSSGKTINHLAIQGIHFWADGRDPSTPGYNAKSQPYGIAVMAGGTDLLIEDVKVARYMTNINFYPYFGQMHDVAIRRSAIVDAYDVGNTPLHAQGLFADGVQGLVLDGNVFDHNGWASNVPGAVPTIFNHDAYVTGLSSGLVAVGNVFANASSHGLQARPGGVIKGNLFLNDPIGLSYGVVNGGGVQVKGGVSGEVSGNVFVGGRDINGAARGIGIEVANIRANSGTAIKGNVFTSYTDGGFAAISLTYGEGVYATDAVGLNDLSIKDNVVYDWSRGLAVGPGLSATPSASYKRLSNVSLKGNEFVDLDGTALINATGLSVDDRSTTTAKAAGLPDITRTVATYGKALGGAAADATFLTEARAQRKGDWEVKYTAGGAVDYVRGGFGMTALTTPTSPTTVPPKSPPASPPPASPPVVTKPVSPPPVATKPVSPPATVPPVVTKPPASPPPVVVSPPVVPPPPVSPPPAATPTEPSQDDDSTDDDHHNGKGGKGSKAAKRDAAVFVKSAAVKVKRGVQQLVVKFSRDVASSIDASDLTLTTADGQALSTAGMTVAYDAKRRTATFVLSADDATKLAKGQYAAKLSAAGIVDDQGHNLDGNRDRTGGDDLAWAMKVKK